MLQKWAREILQYQPVKQQFILSGNINDIYPASVEESSGFPLPLSQMLSTIMVQSSFPCNDVVSFDPMYGFTLEGGDGSRWKNVTGIDIKVGEYTETPLVNAFEAIEKVSLFRDGRIAIILNFASRLTDIEQKDINKFLYQMHRLSLRSFPVIISGEKSSAYGPIFWVFNKDNDLPPWFEMDNPLVHSLVLPLPDNEVRKSIFDGLLSSMAPFDTHFNKMEEIEKKKFLNDLSDQTSRMLSRDISSIIELTLTDEVPSIDKLDNYCNAYKLGIVENPWSKLDKNEIKNSESILSKRVMGQSSAVSLTSDVIKRSMYNLSGAQFSSNSRKPKGVLFFAGPTGVGKTELAKAATELIFGSETNYIRFDMSEFSSGHADQRLFGAPPGYVGYEGGGELTNAIKQNPFSIILFDEIEKADRKILDSFLQILDDGRLTSGKGETVYFTESLIIFTSNLGMYEVLPDGQKRQRVSSDMPYEEIEKEINGAIEDYFKFTIGRPEILNRIGKNIVVFDFIRDDVSKLIFNKMIGKLLQRLKEDSEITLIIPDDVRDKLEKACTEDLTMGGRGIGNAIEQVLINPLSRKLFEFDAEPGSSITLQDIMKVDNLWDLVLE